jgi:hypothetical protein
MHNDQRQSSPILLPVTMAEHGDAGFYFNESPFGFREGDAAVQKKSRERLYMPAAQPGTRPKN